MRIERLRLKKLNNTRDLGGFPVADGRKIKHGMLIRSGKLSGLPECTVDALKDIGVKTVIDMRISKECEEYPYTEIEGAEYINLPVLCTATTGITHEKSMATTMLKESKRIKSEFGSADNYIKKMYEMILFTEDSQSQLKKFFDILINSDGCVLWNCSAGKDRTGIVAMLIEGLLGVDEKLIIEDYKISDKFQRNKRVVQKFGLLVVPFPARFKRILFAFMKAKPQYITGAMDDINERYGSIEGYCVKALGITEEEIKLLKDKYLE